MNNWFMESPLEILRHEVFSTLLALFLINILFQLPKIMW